MPISGERGDIYAKTCGEREAAYIPSTPIIQAPSGATILNAESAARMGRIFAQENAEEIQRIIVALGEVDQLDGIPVTKAFTGISVAIGTTPTHIITPNEKRSYLLLNPATESSGQTTSDTVVAAGSAITGTTATSDIDVNGVEDLHIFWNPTVITGSWSVWLQAKDPVTGSYADVQKLFDTDDADISAGGGPYYAYVGSLGIGANIRFRFVEDAAGGLTHSLGITRKKNVGSLDISAGVPLTIYLGNSGVSTGSGYPLLEGEERFFTIDQNVALYGVAQTAVNLKLFQLEA